MSPSRSSRARRLVAGVALAASTAGLVLAAPASPAAAASGSGTGPAGQRITVSEVSDVDPAGQTVTVTGTGFTAAAGFDVAVDGMYLALCVDQGPTLAPSPCLGGVDQTGSGTGARWITNNAIGGAVAVPITASGTFTTTLVLDADDGTTSCFTLTGTQRCKVVTRMDHRASGDRSQDVKVPVRFAGQPRSASESFVTAAHVDFLGEAPTPAELDADVTALAQGRTKATYLRTLSTSDAWLKGVVDKLYQDTLGRDADAEGLAHWTGELRRGVSVARVAAGFYASGEYYRGFGGNTDAGWVNDLYAKILLRSADAEGRAYWVGEIASKGRTSVALRMYQSPESARTRVRGLYATLLGRSPESGGLAFWAGEVVKKGDLALAVNLATSAEYSNRAAVRFP